MTSTIAFTIGAVFGGLFGMIIISIFAVGKIEELEREIARMKEAGNGRKTNS